MIAIAGCMLSEKRTERNREGYYVRAERDKYKRGV